MTHTTLDADLVYAAVSEAIDAVHENDDHPNALTTITDFVRRALRNRQRLQLDRARRYVAEMRRSRLAPCHALRDQDTGLVHWAVDGTWLGAETPPAASATRWTWSTSGPAGGASTAQPACS